MSNVIEIVHFKLVEGANSDNFAKSAEIISEWAKSQKGFQYRSLNVNDAGEWTDIVYWDSLENAQAASQNFMESNGNSEFMAMIDASTLKMGHSDIKLMTMA